ncbi:Vacuolar membrane amino acid uptake transporter fnx2 [Apiospora phragmitis]|uniref:Vacuolar membrane amino acid uptake transporter fnx2 n=1 Tax=Apiospora phragmitis TaxID=2905665 RepID=A0ABR1TT75_9PEZI
MAVEEQAPQEVAGTTSETAPLLGSAASAQGDTAAPHISKFNGNSGHGTFSRDTADPELSSGNGNTGGAKDNEPKIKVNLAQPLPALAIGIYLVAMDQTLTIATYGKMGSDLNALNNTSWIATSYFLTLTTFQPLYGRLSDIFGRKVILSPTECLLFAYSVFGIGCLGCGLAQDIIQLCIARGVAGMGGGGMNAVVSILVTDLVSLRDRGVWQGYINIVFGAGIASGGPIGGLLTDTIGWRWAFAGQFPIAILAWIAVFTVLQSPPETAGGGTDHWRQKLLRIDFLGAFALSAAAFVLLYGLDNGANEGWGRPVTVVPLTLTPVLFAVFVFVEVRVATDPFAPGHVILDPPLLAAYGANFFGVAAQMGFLFFIAMFYQAAMALTATQSGLMFVPSTVLGLTGSLGGGLVMRRTGKYYGLMLAGYSILLLSIVPLVLFTGALTKSVIGVVVGMAFLALGASISNPRAAAITTTLIAIIANCAPEDMAIAVACSYLFRSLGTTIGISLSTAVLQQVLCTELAARLRDGGRAAEIEARVRESLDYIWTLPPPVAATVRDCYAVATTWAFLPVALLACLCLVSTAFIREKKLDR